MGDGRCKVRAMRRALAAGLLALAVSATRAQSSLVLTVNSPDGRTAIVMWRDGPLFYRVTRDGEDVIARSPLGIRRADQDFGAKLNFDSMPAAMLTFVGADDVRTIDERYTMRSGKAREHHVVARERTIHFKSPTGAPLDITLRAQNDGVAFRYR